MGTGDERTRIAVSKDVRDLLRAQKRGGESYDDLLRKMIVQYEPPEETAEQDNH